MGANHFLNRGGYPQVPPIYAEKGARVCIPWDRWRPASEDARGETRRRHGGAPTEMRPGWLPHKISFFTPPNSAN